jgi:hypothetical protein
MTLQHGFELEFKLADERTLQLEQESFENIICNVFHERLSAIYDVKPKRLAKSTGKRYGIAFRKFSDWCKEAKVCSLPCLPVFVAAHLHEEITRGASKREIQTASYAIAYAHTRKGYPTPCEDNLVRAVVRASGKLPTQQETN